MTGEFPPVRSLIATRNDIAIACAKTVYSLKRGETGTPRPRTFGFPAQALCADSHGQIWLSGSAADGTTQIGRLGKSGQFEEVWSQPHQISHLQWSGDDSRLYAIAPDLGAIPMLFMPGSRTVRRLTSVPFGAGRLNGIALDHGEGIWTALHGGWALACFSPEGNHARTIALPAPYPSEIVFDGLRSNRIYVAISHHDNDGAGERAEKRSDASKPGARHGGKLLMVDF